VGRRLDGRVRAAEGRGTGLGVSDGSCVLCLSPLGEDVVDPLGDAEWQHWAVWPLFLFRYRHAVMITGSRACTSVDLVGILAQQIAVICLRLGMCVVAMAISPTFALSPPWLAWANQRYRSCVPSHKGQYCYPILQSPISACGTKCRPIMHRLEHATHSIRRPQL
jgi:hypothetical protein